MKMKKILSLCGIVLLFSLTACAKTKPKQNSSPVEAQAIPEAVPQAVPEPAPLDPKIEKLNRVLLSMTDRCKEAIPNGDPNEFLADLEKVLQVEKPLLFN